MLFLAYNFGKFVSLRMPVKVGYRLATLFSFLYYSFSKNDRFAVLDNLRVIFPERDNATLSSMAKQVFINFGKYLIDFFRFSKIDRDFISKYVKIEGLEYLKSALNKKKGVIVAGAHLGNWELGGVAISVMGFPFAVVALDHRNRRINRFFLRQRQMKGVEVIPIGLALRRCFSILANNRILGLLGDRDYFDNGIEIEFLGKRTIIPKGPAVFARRCGSPIVPTFMIRNPDDTFTFKFYEPIMTGLTNNKDEDLLITTKKITKVLEDVIRSYPTQWYVFRRFWERIGWVK